MEPKDLKNSEELKSTAKTDLEKIEKSSEPVDEKSNEPEAEVLEKNKETVITDEKAIESPDIDSDKTVETTVAAKEKVEKKPKKAVQKVEVKSEVAVVVEKTEAKVEKKTPVAKVKEEIKPEVAEVVVEDSEVKVEEKTPVADVAKEAVVEKEEKIPAVEVKEVTESANTSEEKAEEVKVEENVVAAKEEKKIEVIKKETVDYTKFSQVELINALRDILENPNDGIDLKAEIEVIKSVFYKSRNENIEEARKVFVDGGGIEEEFVAEEDPYEKDLKDLLKEYRQIRIEHNKKLDVVKEENLQRKYEVIEKIKGLINNEESINRTFNEFRDLQREWREIGLVPQAKMKNLWDLYHFHVENFYDYIKINQELRDLDLRKNLEIKIQICEKAEELLVEPSIIKAFNTLQKYHEEWREAGPVPRENKDDIWERFKSVTSKINKKHQEFFESRKLDQKKNLDAKTALCEKVEEICEAEIENFRDWDVRSKELVELQKIWRTIGFAPKKDNNKIYERFRTACDSFFNKKREFYSKNKELQQNNLQQKIDLCVQAESLKDSTDWKKTTQDFINIQKDWKEIGPIPRKHSDAIWNRFRAACDYFFDKKSEHFSDVDSEQDDNLKLKEDLIAEVINFKSTGDVNENLKILKDFQRRWTEIGHVPFKKKDDTQNRFREAINILFDNLNINEDKRNFLKFKSKMSSYSESNRGQNKMRMEREKYMNKLKQLESDLILLDNNIGFFAKSKNAESLINDVKKKIEDSKEKIEMLKEKIRVIDSMDNY